MRNLLYLLWLCGSVSLSFSSKAVDCTTDTIGLCTPTIEEIIEESITEEIIHEADGITIITTTTTDITTTTIINEDSGDLLDGDNNYVTSKFEGDMDIDWGGQGPASMPSGSACGNLGTDKCAMITGSGNSTSAMGVEEGMGTTFINTIDISSLNITKGGETNYTIKVDKQDANDSIYMHITGKNGNTNVFSGTDILSASGTNSGYKSYEGGWDFSGSLTTVIIEIGGRDISLSIGPLFDDVTVSVLYNVVNTIITQQITSVEMFIALNIDTPEDVIDVVEDIFDSNEMNDDFVLEPIQIDEVDYDAVVVEIEEIEMAEIEIEVMEMEIEVEAELELEIEETVEETIEVTEDIKEEAPQELESQEETKEEETESTSEVVEEKKEQPIEKEQEKKEEVEKPKEIAKKESSKEKAVKKIMKKIDDKKRYDDVSQTKTLVVMQVLGNTRTFFDTQQALNDRVDFFSDVTLPDTVISDNNIASYFLFAGSDGLMNDMIDSQWQTDSE